MSAARAYLADDLPMPRHARHLYLVAVDGRIVERVGHNTAAQNQHRSRADRMPTGTLAIPRIDTILFTDGLKRVLQTKKDATIHVSPMSGTQDVMTVSGRVIFDALGRTVERYYPVTEAKGGNHAFNPGFDTIAPTRTSYDVLDRTSRPCSPTAPVRP